MHPGNLGYRLLRKAGYRGGGLGREGTGTAEPISLRLKSDRVGLGVAERASEACAVAAAAVAAAEEQGTRDFKHGVARGARVRRAIVHLRAARDACWELDSKRDVGWNWMWETPRVD